MVEKTEYDWSTNTTIGIINVVRRKNNIVNLSIPKAGNNQLTNRWPWSILALNANSFISLYLVLEYQSLSLIGLIFLSENTIMTSAKVLLSARIKFFHYLLSQSSLQQYWMNMVFSLVLLFGVALIYFYTCQTMIQKGVTFVSFKPNFSLVFFIVGLIGKCGLFVANLGNICIVDGISLFSTFQGLVLNKIC